MKIDPKDPYEKPDQDIEIFVKACGEALDILNGAFNKYVEVYNKRVDNGLQTLDYRLLLKKYMNHVGEQEGTYFTGNSLRFNTTLTPEEFKELKLLADEVNQEF